LSINKKWINSAHPQELIKHICSKFNISPVFAKILLNRSIESDDEINAFINTDESQFLNPMNMLNMDIAVNCIKKSVDAGEKIAIYGDYDVDGITSTYILYDYVKSLGADVIFYIPDRETEGYGLNLNAIDYLSKEDVKLIITVDVGITAVNEVEYAKEKGIKTVITDHHTPPSVLPDADAVVNPKIPGSEYKNKNLAGVGVAFKLVYALSGCNKHILEKYCEIAAIGTIADMVPLIGENRFIAKFGLDKLSSTNNEGIKALINVSGIDDECITSANISFAIAPRLNAAGRIASAKTSVELLFAKDKDEAMRIASLLDDENKLRQQIEQEILDQAIAIIETKKYYNDKVIVVENIGWHHGIIGIVSSKITEKYHKPSAVISVNTDGSAKASGRSIKGFNLFDALCECENILEKYGGHELAAGFSLDSNRIDEFRKKINDYANSIITDEMLIPTIEIDAEIEASDINLKTANELKLLEPHGIGNKTPVLALYNSFIKKIRIHKSKKHAFLSYTKSSKNFESPAFNMAEDVCNFSYGDHVSIAGTIGINSYRGCDSAQFVVKDINVCPQSKLNVDNMRSVYRCIKDFIENGKSVFMLNELATHLIKNYGCSIGTTRLKIALDILQELDIINIKEQYNTITAKKGINFSAKCNLESSIIFKNSF